MHEPIRLREPRKVRHQAIGNQRVGLAGWEGVSLLTRGLGPAGRACVSQPARGPAAMGGGRKGKGKPSRRRNPQKDWGDLEFLLCQALRHGSSKSALGWHDLRGKLGSNGWVSVKEAAEAMQVSEEDIKESVGWQRKEKTRVELDGSGDYVRALQGHTPDSGLSKDDFHSEELTVKDTDLLAHGTLTERIPSILSKGLVASGGGSREGRLFVHWSTLVFQQTGRQQFSGLRTGSDCIVVARVGTLREANVQMTAGNEGVVLTGDVPSSLFERISAFNDGEEKEILWSQDGGLVPAEIPTGDTSTSELEILVVSRAAGSSSNPSRGHQEVKEEPREEKKEPSESSESESSASSERESARSERSESPEDKTAQPEVEDVPGWWTLPENARYQAEMNKEVVSRMESERFSEAPGTEARRNKVLARYKEVREAVRAEIAEELKLPPAEREAAAEKRLAKWRVKKVLTAASYSGELKRVLEEKPQDVAGAMSRPPIRSLCDSGEPSGSQQPPVRKRAASDEPRKEPSPRGPATKRSASASDVRKGTEEADKKRGVISKEELKEIWSKKPRTGRQRALEHTLAGAASDELRYQEKSQAGFANLVRKESEKSTPGGLRNLESQVKVISTSPLMPTARQSPGSTLKQRSG